jgi:hypothetical protein
MPTTVVDDAGVSGWLDAGHSIDISCQSSGVAVVTADGRDRTVSSTTWDHITRPSGWIPDSAVLYPANENEPFVPICH